MCRAPPTSARAQKSKTGATKERIASSPKKKMTNGFVDDSKPATIMNRPMQAAFALGMVVPFVVGMAVDPLGFERVGRWLSESVRLFPTYATSPLFVFAFLCLCVERACYTWVWVFTKTFERFCSRLEKLGYKKKSDTPVDVIVSFFWVNKFFQYGGFALFYLLSGPFPAKISAFPGLLGLSFLIVGQILNAGIYAAIGKNGVYYGCKFNQRVPWCTGFPFNVVTAHPQYLGSVLTTFGAGLFLATDKHVTQGWLGLAAVQAALYFYMAYVEHNL